MRPIVATGWGVRITVVDGRLVVRHGDPDERVEVVVGRAERPAPHLILAWRTGYLTAAATRWVRAVGGAITILDEDGQPELVTAGEPWLNGRLRRAQARADGLEVCRTLIRGKLVAQAETLAQLPEVARKKRQNTVRSPQSGMTPTEKMAAYLGQIDRRSTLAQLQNLEAVAAAAYWQRLALVPVAWRGEVPEHWRTLGRRHHHWSTAIRNDGYAAITPGQALVNYAYGFLYSEAIQACYRAGLDPAIGYMHGMTKVLQRAEFAMDLMEPVRPVSDCVVLDLVAGRIFTRGDAMEKPNGGIALSHKLRRELIETLTPRLRSLLDVHATEVRKLLKRSIRPQRTDGQLESS